MTQRTKSIKKMIGIYGLNRSTSRYKVVQINSSPNCSLQSDHTVESAHLYTSLHKNLNIITFTRAAIRLDVPIVT